VIRQHSKWTARVTGPDAAQRDDDGAALWWIPYRCDRPGLESVLVAQWRRDESDPWQILPTALLHADTDGAGFVSLRASLGDLPEPPTPERPVWIRVYYVQALDAVGVQNNAIGSSVALCRGRVERQFGKDGPEVDQFLGRSASHEAGHALNLVTSWVKSHDGHDHCRTPNCVMEPGIAPDSGEHFHAGTRSCNTWLRDLDLSRDGPRAAVLGS